jgi:hypothetical protein
MDAFGVLRDVLDDYKSFVKRFLNIRDPDVLEKVEEEVSNGLMWPEPWLALNPASGMAAPSVTLSSEDGSTLGCREIFRARTSRTRSARIAPGRRPSASPPMVD